MIRKINFTNYFSEFIKFYLVLRSRTILILLVANLELSRMLVLVLSYYYRYMYVFVTLLYGNSKSKSAVTQSKMIESKIETTSTTSYQSKKTCQVSRQSDVTSRRSCGHKFCDGRTYGHTDESQIYIPVRLRRVTNN